MRRERNTAPRLLIVDDDQDIRDSLSQYFRTQGMRTSTAGNASEARNLLHTSAIDLVILDIMMPGEDGLSLCRWMAENSQLPVILLTAMATDMDRIVGLEMGADDYVVKPFNPRVLLARVRAVLRRHPGIQTSTTGRRRRFNNWTHDPGIAVIESEDGSHIKLTSSENRLLGTFLDTPNTTLKREFLVDRVLGREEKAYDRAIDNTIARLRKKLEPNPSTPTLLVTEWGMGYKLIADVKEIGSC